MTRFLFYIVSLFLIAGGAQAQTKTTIQEGLKEAGWATVPTFLMRQRKTSPSSSPRRWAAER